MNITEARIDHLSGSGPPLPPRRGEGGDRPELERILDYMAVLDGLDTAGADR